MKEEPAKTAAPEAPKKEVPPVKLTVAPAKTDNLPEDSILKRHAAQLKAAATQTVATKSAPAAPAQIKTNDLPEDSILKRHAAQLKAAATQTVATKSAPVAPAKPAVSEVPTDSILRRHYEALHK